MLTSTLGEAFDMTVNIVLEHFHAVTSSYQWLFIKTTKYSMLFYEINDVQFHSNVYFELVGYRVLYSYFTICTFITLKCAFDFF